MLISVPSSARRLLAILTLGLIAAAGLVWTQFVVAQPVNDRGAPVPAAGYASVTVDTSALGASLYGPTGERLRSMMTEAMKGRFDITDDAGAPHLVVRITGIVLPTNFGLDRQSDDAGLKTTDRLDGETLIVAPDGALLNRYPVTATSPSSLANGESGVEPDFRRLGELVDSYAGWSARYADPARKTAWTN